MTQKTNNNQLASEEAEVTTDQVSQDFKNAVMIVSVIANLAVFTAWITLRIA